MNPAVPHLAKLARLFHSGRFAVLFAAALFATPAVPAAEPLRALLITGGCCHDFQHQKDLIATGVSARANVTWTIIFDPNDTREHMLPVYTNADWARGYDVIVHDECYGYVTNIAFVEGITRAHSNGVPAVTLHCSTHSYRMTATDEWRKLLGVSSYQHEKLRAFSVVNLRPEHPVMKGFPARWDDAPDEMYEIKKLWPDCVPLGQGEGTTGKHVCIWVNTYGKARVFGTTLGHSNDTVSNPVYLDLVTRGLLWACGRLDDQGQPLPGYGK